MRVATLGGGFLREVRRAVGVPDFPSPGDATTLRREASLQNFVIIPWQVVAKDAGVEKASACLRTADPPGERGLLGFSAGGGFARCFAASGRPHFSRPGLCLPLHPSSSFC